jgi:hypothetical protein
MKKQCSTLSSYYRLKTIFYLLIDIQAFGIKNADKRFNIIYPDTYTAFDKCKTSLTGALLYSTRTLRRIKTLIRGKPAYIVPGVVGNEELRVALVFHF